MELFFEERDMELEERNMGIVGYDKEDSKLLNDILVNESSYLGKKLATNINVPASIGRKEFHDFWEQELKAPPFIMDIVRSGYRIPLDDRPPGGLNKNIVVL